MKTTEDFEHELVESIKSGAALGPAAYMLLGHLCDVLTPRSVTSPDGVFFVFSEVTVREASAVGIAVMIEQNVEPLLVKFTLSQGRNGLASSWIHLGDETRTVSYGSREHGKLEKAIIANPEQQYPWKLVLQRTEAEWLIANDAG